MNQSNIKWIFFDMGGVILDDSEAERLRQETLLQVAKRYIPDLSMTDIRNAWLIASQKPGSVRILALRELFKDSPKLKEAEDAFIRECVHNYHELSSIRSEAKEVLEKLSRRYNLGMAANQTIKTVDRLEEASLLQYFSHQKMSEHIGLEKPDPNFFKAILEDSGAKVEESAVVDDNYYRGLVPAKQVGLTTILYKRELIPFPEDAKPNFTVSNLEALVTLFINS